MFQRRINLWRRSSKLSQNLLISVGCRHLDLYHFINKAGKFCPFRTAENEFAFFQMGIGIVEHIVHAKPRYFAHNFRLLFVRNFRKLPLRLLKAGKDILVMFAYQRLEQFFLTFVITIKGSGSHAY